ncbi:MAG TPA: GNAT family N-acetyltransferase [Thermomicrobiales bacterium]
MKHAEATLQPLTPGQIPALLATWEAHQRRVALNVLDHATWQRPLDQRRTVVETWLRAFIANNAAQSHAVVALRGEEIAAYLIASEVHLSRNSGYRAYAPDHFLSIGGDDWGLADPRDAGLLTNLYADLAAWGLSRGADAQMLAVRDGDDTADFWLDLGFARQDRYAFLPIGASPPATAGLTVRRGGPADLDVAAHFTLAEAHFHHLAPIFAFAPPDLDADRRQSMAGHLADPSTFILLAEAGGVPLGGLSAFPLTDLGHWMPSTTPTPCIYIDSAFVEPQARGRGVLRALVAALAELAERHEARGLFVTYLPANRGALRAWQGLGFQPLVTVHQRRLDPRATKQHRNGP